MLSENKLHKLIPNTALVCNSHTILQHVLQKDCSMKLYVFGVKMWVNWLATDRNHFQAYQKYDGLETCTLQNPSIIGI